jgi:DNA-binding NtrC family response regulator
MANGKPLVLIIDDDETIRESAQEVLEISGFAVLTADNGRTGVDVFAGHVDEIAIVLLDLTMPEMSGDKALQEIHAIQPEARVVLMSGYNEVETVKRFAGQKRSGFLKKPLDLDDLLDKVNEVLGQ